jgi:hypothetical protein
MEVACSLGLHINTIPAFDSVMHRMNAVHILGLSFLWYFIIISHLHLILPFMFSD